LVETVHAFAAGAPQSDDITVLAIRYGIVDTDAGGSATT
jgi:hypothetical protein